VWNGKEDVKKRRDQNNERELIRERNRKERRREDKDGIKEGKGNYTY